MPVMLPHNKFLKDVCQDIIKSHRVWGKIAYMYPELKPVQHADNLRKIPEYGIIEETGTNMGTNLSASPGIFNSCEVIDAENWWIHRKVSPMQLAFDTNQFELATLLALFSCASTTKLPEYKKSGHNMLTISCLLGDDNEGPDPFKVYVSAPYTPPTVIPGYLKRYLYPLATEAQIEECASVMGEDYMDAKFK